jgi:hypothetical protein
MFTWTFWKRALERAIKTFIVVMIPLVTMNGALATDVTVWKSAALAAAATALSVIASMLSSLVGGSDSPSIVD